MAQKKIQGVQADVLIDELSDVQITSVQNGDRLTYNGSQWVNASGGTTGFRGATITASGSTTSVRSTTVSASPNFVPNNLSVIQFDTAALDIGSWYNSSHPGRLYIPSGITVARFTGSVRWPLSSFTTSAAALYLQIYRNGSQTLGTGLTLVADKYVIQNPAAGLLFNELHIDTGWIPVVAGEYYDLRVTHFLEVSSITITSTDAWFSAEGRTI